MNKFSFAIVVALVLCIAPIASVAAQPPYPVTNASVTVSGPGYNSTTTDANGNFSINQGLPTGSYTINITNPGYISYTGTASVTAGEVTDLGLIYLNTSGVIAGTVENPDGTAASGAVVTLYNANDISVASTTTASDGTFTLDENIVTGTYYIIASVPSSTSYASGETAGISATQGSLTSGITVTLTQTGAISGTIADTSDTGVANITVTAVNTNSSLAGIYYGSAVTDSNGDYDISSNLAAGTYNITLSGEPAGLIVNSTPTTVNVTAGSTTTASFTLQPSGSISGTVTYDNGQPVAGATVNASSTDGIYLGSATTAADGTYTIDSGLGTDNYTVYASFGGVQATSTANVSVTAGNTTSGVSFAIPADPAWISGTIIDNTTGLAIQNVNVTGIYSLTLSGVSSSYSNSTATDVNGNYTLLVNAPTDNSTIQVNVTASAEGYLPSSQLVNVSAGQTAAVSFSLEELSAVQSGTIVGEVVSESQPALQNATLSLTPSTTSGSLGFSLTLSGTLSPVQTGNVTIWESINGSDYANLTTVALASDGSYTYTFTPASVGNYTFLATWPGNNLFNPANSTTTAVSVTPEAITLGTSSSSVTAGSSVTLSGTTSLSSTTLIIYMNVNSTGYQELTTVNSTNGAYSYTYTPTSPGNYTFQAYDPSTAQYSPASTVSVSAAPTPANYTIYYVIIIGVIIVIMAVLIYRTLRKSSAQAKPKT